MLLAGGRSDDWEPWHLVILGLLANVMGVMGFRWERRGGAGYRYSTSVLAVIFGIVLTIIGLVRFVR